MNRITIRFAFGTRSFGTCVVSSSFVGSFVGSFSLCLRRSNTTHRYSRRPERYGRTRADVLLIRNRSKRRTDRIRIS